MRLLPALVLAVLGPAVLLGALAPPAAAATVTAQDKAFMTANAQTNLAEISLSQLALKRTQTIGVRNLATTLMIAHRKAQTQLTDTARAVGFTLPTKPNATQLAQAAKLGTTPVLDFDKTWLTVEQQGHVLSIKNTQTEIQQGSDPAVVSYARSYLPTARMHLGLINAAIKGTHVSAAPVAPPTPLHASPAAVVTAGQLAHGAKTHPSSDAPWLIGALVLLLIIAGGGLMRLRFSMSKRR